MHVEGTHIEPLTVEPAFAQKWQVDFRSQQTFDVAFDPLVLPHICPLQGIAFADQ